MPAGSVELICGCMFSGKTTELISRVRALADDVRLVCLKPAIDDRYSKEDIVSHDGERFSARIVQHAADIVAAADGADVVALDEVHFFGAALLEVCHELSQRGQRVICCGLDRDMWGDVFPAMAKLGETAQVTELFATCAACQAPGNRTHRKVPLIAEQLVGGSAEFEARCEKCFRPPQAPKPATQVPGLAEPPGP